MERTKEYFFEHLDGAPRLFVLECAIYIEDFVSETLGKLLNIDLESSKTLRNLSFRTKVDLIREVKSLQDDERKKFELFMQIRNKFAHEKIVNTFHNLFISYENLNFKTRLEESSRNQLEIDLDHEFKYKLCYMNLVSELHEILFKIQLHDAIKQTSMEVRNEMNNDLLEIIKSGSFITDEDWAKIIDQHKENQSNKKSK